MSHLVERGLRQMSCHHPVMTPPPKVTFSLSWASPAIFYSAKDRLLRLELSAGERRGPRCLISSPANEVEQGRLGTGGEGRL